MLREGEGAKLREGDGATRILEGATARGATTCGVVLRGSTRMRSGALRGVGALGRGVGALGRTVDHEDAGGGALRRGASRVTASREPAGMRGDELLRRRASDPEGTRCRVTSAGAMRLLVRRVLAGGAVRTAGSACAGTRAADMAGPRGARDGPMGGGAGRALGAAAVRREGCAGA